MFAASAKFLLIVGESLLLLVSTGKFLFLKHPLGIWKSGMDFSTDLEINQLRAVNLPFKP